MSTESPTKEWFLRLVKLEEKNRGDRGAAPYPFYLASPVNLDQIKKLPVQEWRLENKWDGIRGQLIRRKSGIYLCGRGEEVINKKLPEIIELKNHPWFVAVQFHPEFKSRPLAPHPLFSSFIKASKNHK